MYDSIASRMSYAPLKGARPETFNGIQQYKEELGFPTKINPKKIEPLNIHKEKIDEGLLRDVAEVKRYHRLSKKTSACKFCDPMKPQ
jgi:hypothetical protein